MENIDQFDIVLNVDDCGLLYDYVECSEYKRPASGKWDLSVFKDKGTINCVDEDDENAQLRVGLLDDAFTDRRVVLSSWRSYREGKRFSSESTIHSTDLLPERVIPVYRPGDVVRGTVELTLNRAVEAEQLLVNLTGKAHVCVWVYNGKTANPVYADEDFTNQTQPLWLQTGTDVTDISDSFTPLSGKSLSHIPRGSSLHAGNHKYPFEFTIPHNTPQSTPPLVISSYVKNKGYLVYRINAAIDKGSSRGKGNIITHKGLWIRTPVNIAANPQNLEPVHVEESLETGTVQFWKSGKVTVNVMLQRVGHVLGDSVSLVIEADNQSKGIIESISSCVRMYGKALISKRVSTSINIKSKKITEGPVAAGMCPVFNVTIPWDFRESSADGNLLPVGTLDDCKLLDIKYEVRIKVKRKGLHRNMEIGIPISVGNVNSEAV